MHRNWRKAFLEARNAIKLPYKIDNVAANEQKFVNTKELNKDTFLGIDNLYYCTAVNAVIKDKSGNNIVGIFHFEPDEGKQKNIDKFISTLKTYKQKDSSIDLTIVRNQLYAGSGSSNSSHELSQVGFEKVRNSLDKANLNYSVYHIDKPVFILDKNNQIKTDSWSDKATRAGNAAMNSILSI